jgi:purine nucleosidase
MVEAQAKQKLTNAATKKVILDIDNALTLPIQDTDDAIALTLALVSPELDVVGITTCAGNCTTHQSTVNTLRMLQLAGAAAIPVAEGRAEPLLRDRIAHFRYLAEKSAGAEASYWRSAPQPPAVEITPLSMPAHEFIHRSITQAPEEITYIALGSFTNLALALLTAPDLAPKIKQVVHMGGALKDPTGHVGLDEGQRHIGVEDHYRGLRIECRVEEQDGLPDLVRNIGRRPHI